MVGSREPEASAAIFLVSQLVTFFQFFFNINNFNGKYYFMVLISFDLMTNGSVCVYWLLVCVATFSNNFSFPISCLVRVVIYVLNTSSLNDLKMLSPCLFTWIVPFNTVNLLK